MNRFRKLLFSSSSFSKENKKPTIILLIAALVLTTWKYYGTKSFYLTHLSSTFVLFNSAAMTAEWYNYFSAFVLLGVSSIAIIKLVFKESLADYGLRVGDWKFWAPAAFIVGAVMVRLSYSSSKDPQYMAEFLLKKVQVIPCCFSRFMLLLILSFTSAGNFSSAVSCSRIGASVRHMGRYFFASYPLPCIAHIGKPDSEIYSSILGALVWGILVFRSKSILPAITTHWLLGVSLDYFICFPSMKPCQSFSSGMPNTLIWFQGIL